MQFRINGTDAPAIMGASKWSNAYELWLIKTGRKDKPDLSDKENVQWGNRLENAVLDHVLQTELNASRIAAMQQVWIECNEHGFPMTGYADYFDGVNLVEIKTANAFSEKEWQAGVPDYYYWQVMHYMIALNLKKCLVACLVGGQKLYCHWVNYDEIAAYNLISAEREFYQCCIDDVAPPMAVVPEAEIVNGMDVDVERLCMEYLALNKELGKLEKLKKELAKNIQQLVGDNKTQVGMLYKAAYTWQTRNGFDDKALAETMPEIHRQFTKETGFYKLDIKEIKQ